MNSKAYNKCVDLYADGLFRFVLKSLGDSDEAEDVVQDAFEKLWLRRDQIDPAKVKSYLFTTVYHAIVDYSRKVKRMADFQQSITTQNETQTTHFDLKEQIDQALKLLPDYQRNVVLLRDYEGYAYQEISEITGFTVEQVKVYIFRARKALRTYLVSIEQLL